MKRFCLQPAHGFPRSLMGLSVLCTLVWLGALPGAEAADLNQPLPSATQLSVPSLWWAKDQFAAKETAIDKLILTWKVYSGTVDQPRYINYVVNRQLWSLLDYLERYTFVNDFGTAAKAYGYDVRIVDAQATPLAGYVCDRNSAASAARRTVALPLRMIAQTFASKSLTAAKTQLPALPATPAIAAIPCKILLESGGKGSLRGGGANPFDANAPKSLGTESP